MHHKAEEEQTAKHGFAIEFNSPKNNRRMVEENRTITSNRKTPIVDNENVRDKKRRKKKRKNPVLNVTEYILK